MLLDSYYGIDGSRYDLMKCETEPLYYVVDVAMDTVLYSGFFADCKRFALAFVTAYNSVY